VTTAEVAGSTKTFSARPVTNIATLLSSLLTVNFTLLMSRCDAMREQQQLLLLLAAGVSSSGGRSSVKRQSASE
jgi:hypothetical protein